MTIGCRPTNNVIASPEMRSPGLTQRPLAQLVSLRMLVTRMLTYSKGDGPRITLHSSILHGLICRDGRFP